MTHERATTAQGPSIGALLREHALALIASAGTTLAVILGIYAVACLTATPAAGCLLATLAVGTIWMAIAAPVLAAGGRDAWGAVLRAAAVADAAGAALGLIWLCGLGLGPGIGLLAAVKVYCVYAVMALAATAAVCVARSPVARQAVGLAAAGVLLLAAASPFWVNGLIDRAGREGRRMIVNLAVSGNPFYAVSAAVLDQTRTVWHQLPVLYGLTRIGEYTAPSPTEWHLFVYRCGLVGLFFVGVAIVRRRFLA